MPRLFACLVVAAALVLSLHPAEAQMSPATPAAATAPAHPLYPLTPPAKWPEQGGGVCQCLWYGEAKVQADVPFHKDQLGLKCLSAVEECKAMCRTDTRFSFVPHAGFSCPLLPDEGAKVAMTPARPMLLSLAAAR